MNKKIKFIMLFSLIIMSSFIPSISFAKVSKNVQNITYGDGKYYGTGVNATGEINDPVMLDGSYDEIVVAFGNNADSSKFEFPFYFKMTGGSSGMKYFKYKIMVSDEDKRVVFKKIGESSSLSSFVVTPYDKKEGNNYLQPGAVFNDNYKNMGFRQPLYKIESFMFFSQNQYGQPSMIKTDLGNSTLNISNSVEGSLASDPQVYVFCVSGLSGSQTAQFSGGQINSATVVVEEITKKKDGYYDIYSAKDTKKAVASSATDMRVYRDSYNLGNSEVEVVYAFWGVTSEILNDNEVSELEKIISKIFISIGDLFRGVVTEIGGADLTIDALIFNQYQKTVVDFWGSGGTYVDIFRTIINGWFTAFRSFATIVLMIVLVFVGLQGILSAGTKNEKKIQGMFSGWVIAVALMFLGPYFMKYAIVMNDALVDVLSEQSEYSIYSVYNTEFMNKLGIEMQLGEDSKTVKLIDMLTALQSEIQEELEGATDEIIKVQAEINRTMYELDQLNGQVRIEIVDSNGIVRSLSEARNKVTYQAKLNNNSNVSSTDISSYVSNTLVVQARAMNSIDGSAYWDSQNGKDMTQEIRELLTDYGVAKERSLQLQEALKATEKAITIANKGIDLESVMRERAGETYRLVYVLVWYIMIFQLVLLLFLYYKRLVIVGVLIIIFPLVVMMYAIEKAMGLSNSKTLKTWITEYIVNIFVQSVHALIYIMLVEAGLKLFEQDSDNWLLFLFAVLAIFPAEAIIKSILGMNATSIRGLKEAGATALAFAGAIGAAGAIFRSGKDIQVAHNKREQSIAEKYANKDKNLDFARKTRDNLEMKNALKSGDKSKIDEAKKRIEERDKERAKMDETKARKREAAKRRRETTNKIRRATNGLTNAVAALDVVTTAGALGFDPEDFQKGAAITSSIRNFTKPKAKKDDKDALKSSKGGSRYAGTAAASRSGSGGARNTSSRAAEEARRAATAGDTGASGSGTGGAQTREQWENDNKSIWLQKLNGHYSSGGTNVNKGTPSIDVHEEG